MKWQGTYFYSDSVRFSVKFEIVRAQIILTVTTTCTINTILFIITFTVIFLLQSLS